MPIDPADSDSAPPPRTGRVPWPVRCALVGMMLAIAAVWGWTFVLVKDAVAIYGVMPFLAVRFLIGAAALAPAGLVRPRPRSLLAGGLIGLVLAAAYLLQTLGLDRTTATNTGVITGLFVVFAPLANRALFGVRTPGILWTGIGASLLGLGLLAGAAPAGVSVGDLVALGGAAAFGLHIALLDRFAARRDAAALACGQVLAAAVVFTAVWLFIERPALPPGPVWPALLITGLVATAGGFFVQTFVQQRLTAVETGSIIVTEPVFAAVFGYLLAGDRLTGRQLCGAGLLVAATATVEVYPRWRARRRRQNGADGV